VQIRNSPLTSTIYSFAVRAKPAPRGEERARADQELTPHLPYSQLCPQSKAPSKRRGRGKAVRELTLDLQYQAVLTTHNAFRKTVKWLGKVQPLVKAFAEMIPADPRLNWGPYDLHTDGFTVMEMLASVITAMDKLPMCELMEQTRNRGSPVTIKSKKMDKNGLQLLVGPQEKSPLRSFLENIATHVKQEVASPELVFILGYAMLFLENGDEQERHNDCDDAIFDQIGRPLERGNMPLSVLASLQEGTKLIIWRGVIGQEPKGSFTRMQLTLKRGEILVFRGPRPRRRVVQAGKFLRFSLPRPRARTAHGQGRRSGIHHLLNSD
jgi:hypothetical protein